MMKYPIGIQSFEQIIKDGYVYVDKTALIYDLVTRGNDERKDILSEPSAAVRQEPAYVHPGELFSGEEGAVRGAGHRLAGGGVAGVSGVSH